MGNIKYNEPTSFEEMAEQEAPVTQEETPTVETDETTE